jgi:ankyrin repeat protein
MARLLLDLGASVNARDPEGLTPLARACWHGRFDISQLLIDRGADVQTRDQDGDTPLMLVWGGSLAFHSANPQLIALLLSHGANIEAQNDQGETPLVKAVSMHDLEATSLLIANGANVNYRDRLGRTPLLVLLDTGYDAQYIADSVMPSHSPNVVKSRTKSDLALDIVADLLAHGADTTIADNHGRSALELAESGTFRRPAVAALLRSDGAKH